MIDKNPAHYFVSFDEYLKKNPNANVCDLGFRQSYALSEIEDLRKQFEEGNQAALLAAIYYCASCNLPLNDWIAYAFIKRYADVLIFAKYKTWDKVFGLPYPKGTHLKALRSENRLKFKVWQYVEEEIKKGLPIDDGLFEVVGEHFKLGKTTVSKYYYSQKKCNAEFHEILKNSGIT